MGLNLNLSKVAGPMDSLKNNAFKETPPGRGMVLVKSFGEYSHAKTGAHELTLEIVAWTNPEGVGVEHTELIFPEKDAAAEEDRCVARLMKIAIATGLITPKEAEDARTGVGELDMDFTTGLPGRPMFVEIIKRKGKDDKEYTNIGEGGFSYYHVRDPRVADWPKHAALINQNLALVGEWEPLRKNDAPAQQPAAKKAANPFAGKV